MKRELNELQKGTHDVLIVGGGFYGAALAREAATRGLKTALVEQSDFCSGSSANSLKIVHGGLRYLQQASLPRVLESIRERSILLRTAPHLAAPAPCLMPTRGIGMKSRPLMACGMWANEILSCRRNRHLDPLRQIAAGKTLSRSETLEILPMLRGSGITGAAEWHDGLAYDTERLVIGMVKAAARAGASVANHVQVRSLIVENNRVVGASVADRIGGTVFEVRAGLVINAAGPWIAQLLATLGKPLAQTAPHLALGMNLVIRNWPVATHALGLQSSTKPRLYFFMPWRGATMAGTYYREYKGSPDPLRATDEDIDSHLAAINTCLPGTSIGREDILAVQLGIVPSARPAHPDREPDLLRHPLLVDHAKRDGLEGLYSVCGVKFTTARGVAEKVIDAVAAKTGKPVAPSTTHRDPLPGGDIPDLATFQRHMAAAHPAVPAPHLERLLTLYGTEAKDIFEIAAQETGAQALLRAECLFALRDEMPQTLGDLVFRRTGIASAGRPEPAILQVCAETMGAERGWNTARIQSEIAAVEKAPSLWQAGDTPPS
jgi:glycerol-3-phosphate dehydrogenase